MVCPASSSASISHILHEALQPMQIHCDHFPPTRREPSILSSSYGRSPIGPDILGAVWPPGLSFHLSDKRGKARWSSLMRNMAKQILSSRQSVIFLLVWLCYLHSGNGGEIACPRDSGDSMPVRVGCATSHGCHAGQYTTAGFLDGGPAFNKGRLPLPIET